MAGNGVESDAPRSLADDTATSVFTFGTSIGRNASAYSTLAIAAVKPTPTPRMITTQNEKLGEETIRRRASRKS